MYSPFTYTGINLDDNHIRQIIIIEIIIIIVAVILFICLSLRFLDYI